MIKSRQKQQGVALITVLLVVALCVILVAEVLTKQNLQVKRLQNITERQQAYWYAQGAEQFVRSLLENTIDDDKGVVNLGQDWATQDMAFPIDDGMIEGEIKDLQACLNLNALFKTEQTEDQRKNHRAIYSRYLSALELQTDVSESDMVNNIYDWLDPDDFPIDGLGYDGDMYATADFPYLVANSKFASGSELRLIDGFNPLVMEKVQSGFCVIPNSDVFAININTIDNDSPEILMALFDIDKGEAESILSARPEGGFEDIADFWQLNEMKFADKRTDLDKSQFTIKSNFFKLTTIAHYQDVAFPLTSIFQLTKDNKMQVIARRFGGTIERKASTETE